MHPPCEFAGAAAAAVGGAAAAVAAAAGGPMAGGYRIGLLLLSPVAAGGGYGWGISRWPVGADAAVAAVGFIDNGCRRRAIGLISFPQKISPYC